MRNLVHVQKDDTVSAALVTVISNGIAGRRSLLGLMVRICARIERALREDGAGSVILYAYRKEAY
jgi:hypothetical protein